MRDADPSAPDGGSLPSLGHPYTHALRLHRGGRGFVALCRKPGTDGRPMDTRCYEGPELFTHLPPAGADGDRYLSVNTFSKPRRTIANLLSLRACFIDLDFWDLPVWAGATEDEIWAEVQAVLTARAVPPPTMVVASGRGVHLYWTFPKGLPREVLPRWNAVQRHLYDELKTFGADPNARDAARILRLAGTVNTRNGKMARFLHLDMDRDVDFEDLARSVLPLTQHELQERRQQRAAQAEEGRKRDADHSNRIRERQRAFVDTMIADIDRLIAYRWGGRIPAGYRNQTLFVRGCFLVRVIGIAKLEDALLAYGLATSDLDEDEMQQIVGSIIAKITEDGRGYRYSTVGAAEALQVTVEEVRAAGLRRLHPADPQLEAARREEGRTKDRERKAAQRRAAGILPRSERPARSQPWKALGIPRSTWYRKYYVKS